MPSIYDILEKFIIRSSEPPSILAIVVRVFGASPFKKFLLGSLPCTDFGYEVILRAHLTARDREALLI